MRKAAFFFGGLLISFLTVAQTYTIDSMKRILRSTTYADSNKVKMCLQLSNEWLKINADSALSYAEKSHELSTTINYQPGMAAARTLQANILTEAGKYDKGYELYLEALHKYTMQNDNTGMGQIYVELGKSFSKQEKYSKAQIYFQQALNVYTKANLKNGIAETCFEQGLMHSSINEVTKAIENFTRAAEIGQQLPDKSIAIKSYLQLCIEYGMAGYNDKALQAATKAKNMALISGNVAALANTNYQLGKSYSSLGNHQMARNAYDVALGYYKQLHDKQGIAKTYDGIGEVYYLQKDYTEAVQSIKLSNQYAFEVADKRLLEQNYNALMSIAKEQGDYKTATEFFDEIIALKDSIYNNEKNATVGKVRSAYELEKKQAMIAELQKDNLDKTHQRNLFIIGFSIVMVSLIGLGFSLVYIKKKTVLLQKQKVELEELNTVKDKFFSIVGHDLRSPMANILSLLQLMNGSNSLSDSDKKMLFEKLRTSTTSALETMDNMLTWGMHQIKASVTEQREVDVQEITQRVCRFLEQSAENKSIKIINHVNQPVKIYADKNQVEFILRNLVSNALKFSHKNGVVELWTSDSNGSKNIHVRDTGMGMSPELKHKLFDLEKNTSTKGTAGETGSGLGLLLTKQFVTKNKGSLTVKSEQGKGSVFTVSLPQAN